MKICWDNIDEFKLTKQGNFKFGKIYGLILKDNCKRCDEPYFIKKNLSMGKIDIMLWDKDKDNGMVVCKNCHHSKIHKNECSSIGLSNVNR